ncbi:hypothetical protein J1605_009324 [Eschrichtius robustus]|uniref:Uncharacterized protein n=1 Tax=Eschrichtius robustus TaxID=9764 RepID=A0AB34GUT5_ESCRO|nr:hypothetical protein J1605_009324 [Eschrichtius robustus]
MGRDCEAASRLGAVAPENLQTGRAQEPSLSSWRLLGQQDRDRDQLGVLHPILHQEEGGGELIAAGRSWDWEPRGPRGGDEAAGRCCLQERGGVSGAGEPHQGDPTGFEAPLFNQLRRSSLSQAIPVVQPKTKDAVAHGSPAAGTLARSHHAHPPEQVPPVPARWVAAPGSGTWPPSRAPRGASGEPAGGGGSLGWSPGVQPQQARRVTGPRPALALGLSVSISGHRGQLASFRATCHLSGHGGAPGGQGGLTRVHNPAGLVVTFHLPCRLGCLRGAGRGGAVGTCRAGCRCGGGGSCLLPTGQAPARRVDAVLGASALAPPGPPRPIERALPVKPDHSPASPTSASCQGARQSQG